MMKNISIVGTGLIGCSIGLGVKTMFKSIAGFDINPQNLDYALKTGMITQSWSIERIAYESDIIIVAVPVDVALTIIPDILNKIKGDTVVIDVGSTKSSICRVVKDHPKRDRFIAAHPMAGSEIGGPQGSREDLFNGRTAIICQSEQSSVFGLNQAKEIFRMLGMTIDYMNEDTHDSLVALVSHLPQIVSYGIANTVGQSMNGNQQWCGIAAGGFDSSTRLAKSLAEVWTPVLMQNKRHISEYLQLFIHQIETIKELIDVDDAEAINRFIHQSQVVREKFDNNSNGNKEKKDGSKTIVRTGATAAVASGIK